MSRTCLRAAGTALVLIGCAVAAPLRAQPPTLGELLREVEPERVTVSMGAFEVLRGAQRKDRVVGGEVQFTSFRLKILGRDLPPLSPILGAAATHATTLYGYFGLRVDYPQGNGWTVSPSAAAGVYSRGSGKRLGGILEFRTALEVSREVRGGRLGLCLYHLSNARFYEVNPGTESLVLTYSLPLRRR